MEIQNYRKQVLLKNNIGVPFGSKKLFNLNSSATVNNTSESNVLHVPENSSANLYSLVEGYMN